MNKIQKIISILVLISICLCLISTVSATDNNRPLKLSGAYEDPDRPIYVEIKGFNKGYIGFSLEFVYNDTYETPDDMPYHITIGNCTVDGIMEDGKIIIFSKNLQPRKYLRGGYPLDIYINGQHFHRELDVTPRF